MWVCVCVVHTPDMPTPIVDNIGLAGFTIIKDALVYTTHTCTTAVFCTRSNRGGSCESPRCDECMSRYMTDIDRCI